MENENREDMIANPNLDKQKSKFHKILGKAFNAGFKAFDPHGEKQSEIIFSHEFLSAYYNHEDYTWRYYAQQLAVTKPSERIDYLFRNIGDYKAPENE